MLNSLFVAINAQPLVVKTGFFNIHVTAGEQTGIIAGEIDINKGL